MPFREDSLLAQYIRAIENPDSAGYHNGVWYEKGTYDHRNRGFGVDIINNKKAAKLVKDRPGKWLTEDEERKLRQDHLDYVDNALETHAPSNILRNPPSEEKKAMALGMLYRGDTVLDHPLTRKAYLDGTDEDMQKAITKVYNDSGIDYLRRRAEAHDKFFNARKQSNTQEVPAYLQRPKNSSANYSYKPQFFTPKNNFHSDGGYLNDNLWNNLSMKEKAEMMKVAISNGITSLPEIREAYNKFAKGGKLQKDEEYEDWLRHEAKLNSSLWGIPYEETLKQMQNDSTYDYRRFYELQKRYPNNPEYQRDLNGNAHYNDIGKTAFHPTASKGSYYSGRKDPKYNPTGAVFGDWLDNGHEYRMSEDMLRAGSSPYDTFNYMSNAEDQGVKLRDERGYMFQDYREPNGTFIDGVLPTVTITPDNKHALGGNLYGKGGKKGVPVNTNSQRAMSYLLNKGMSRTGASAIVGTLQAESNLDPTIHAKMKGDNGEGIAQWTGSRKKNFWKTLEQIEPGAQKRYKNIVNVPLERQLDVVLSERPDVTNAIHGAKDVSTATDIMLRGYENGGGTVKTMASKSQMDSIYGKWNNGYNNQIKKRLGNANVLLGNHIAPTSYEIPQGFFDDIDSQIQVPTMQFPTNDIDPSTIYKAPTIDTTLFTNPKSMEEAPIYNPQEDRLEGLRRLGSVMGLMRQSNPLVALGNSTPGLLSYVSQIYGL